MHHDHNTAHRAGLAMPELARIDPAGLAPLGTAGAAPPGLSPPESETADARNVGRIGEHAKSDDAIVAVDYCDGKRQANLTANLALLGYSLHELSGGTFLVCRWDRSRHLVDLHAVASFLRQAGGSA